MMTRGIGAGFCHDSPERLKHVHDGADGNVAVREHVHAACLHSVL